MEYDKRIEEINLKLYSIDFKLDKLQTQITKLDNSINGYQEKG